MDLTIAIIQGVIIAATPLVFASIGELVTERAGVLNLGVEGMMIIGAIMGFALTLETGSPVLGLIGAAVCGAGMAAIFGVLTQVFLSDHVPTGLALTIFGLGLAALLGQGYAGYSVDELPRMDIAGLSDLPVIGPVLFSHDPLVYLSLALVVGTAVFLRWTRAGMVLRAVGENHEAAHAIGFPVVGIRFAALLFGGACAGLGGAYLSMVQTPLWAEEMTAGRGWIALAIVVFASWRPSRVLIGAYLFGGVSNLQLHAQGIGIPIEAQYMSMLPYLATVLVLVMISRDKTNRTLRAPACLGKRFFTSS